MNSKWYVNDHFEYKWSLFLDNSPAEFQIDDTYSVPGVGTVVSGTCFK